jgi:D-serine deaminase-like pyridoxal phosphate-dependent protein
MKIKELSTPSFLVDLDQLDRNIKSIQNLCDDNGKELWPMVKTHKSTQIAKMQINAGAKGFLVGTLDEAEILAKEGIEKITYAYPVASEENINRIIEINKNTEMYISIDCKEQLQILDDKLKEDNMKIKALIIVDSGLGRFGVEPENVVGLAKEVEKYKNIELVGISTHPGQVYSSRNMEDVKKYANQEVDSMKVAKNKLIEAGCKVDMVATGSTPTMSFAAKDGNITVLRPGNYVFYDNIQMSIGLVEEDDCALTVLATVVSHPKEDLFLIDAGSKCFGLDKGAHGISLMRGYGYVKGHPELIVSDLSEEVAKVKVEGETNIKIGDKIRIIPNHACSSANFTNYLIGHRGDEIEEIIHIDMRGGSVRKPPIINNK